MTIEEAKAKRKWAIKAVCTLGLSTAPWGMLFGDLKDSDKGFSFQGTVFGFVFRVCWFLLWLIVSMVIGTLTGIYQLFNTYFVLRAFRSRGIY